MTGSEGDGCRSSFKKKIKRGFYAEHGGESEKSLVLHRPLSVYGKVHLPFLQGVSFEPGACD